MSDRIPEFSTHARPVPRADRPPTNPFLTALTAIWVIALLVAVVCVVIAFGQSGSSDYFVAVAATAIPLGIAAACASIAFFVGIAHLAVKAVLWRSPGE